MVRSFNFLIATGYPEHWMKSVNKPLHVYGFIQAVLNVLQFHLSYKGYASHTSSGFAIDIWKRIILDLWFKNKFHKH